MTAATAPGPALLRAVGRGSNAVGKWLIRELEALPEERRRYAVQAVGYLMGCVSAAKLAAWLKGETGKTFNPRDAEMFAPTVRRHAIVANDADELLQILQQHGGEAVCLVLAKEDTE